MVMDLPQRRPVLREVIAGVKAAQWRLTAEAKVAVAPELKSVPYRKRRDCYRGCYHRDS